MEIVMDDTLYSKFLYQCGKTNVDPAGFQENDHPYQYSRWLMHFFNLNIPPGIGRPEIDSLTTPLPLFLGQNQ
jgi:hypothetical protein